MKRVYSFLLACFTILVIMVATVPNLKDSIQTSAEYKSGYEVVYNVKSVLGDEVSVTEEQIKKAADVMQKRINDQGLNDSSVVYEGTSNLTLNLIAEDYSEADSILNDYIEVNKVVTVGDSTYPERYTFDEVFDGSSIEWEVNYSSYTYQLIVEATKDGESKLDKLGEDLVITIWNDYYGDEKDTEGNFTTISDITFSKGKAKITYSDAQAMLDESFVMAYGDLGVILEKTSMIKEASTYDKYALTKYFISIAVVVALVSVIFIRFYKKAGILGSVLTVFASAFTLIGFYWLNGTYSLLSCLGIVISIGLSTDLFVGITQKVRTSLYKGRNATRAFSEGYLKSLPLIIDSLLVVIGSAIVMYYAGKGDVKSLALMTFASGVSNMIFVAIGYYITGTFLLGSKEIQDKNFFNINKEMIVSLNSEVITSNEDVVYGSSFKKCYKLFLPVTLIVVVLAVILGTTMKLTDNNIANFKGSYATNYVLRVNVENDAFNEKDKALKVFDDIDLEYNNVEYGSSAIYDEEENLVSSYVISFYGEDKSLLDNEAEVVEAVKAIVGEDYEESMVYASTYNYPLVAKNTTKVITASLFVLLFLVVYFLIRYRLKMTLSAIAGSVIAVATYLGVAVLTRLPFNLSTLELIPLVLLLSFLFSGYTFEKVKVVVKDNKEYTKEGLIETVAGSVNYRLVFSLYVYSLVLLVLIAMSDNLTVLSNVLAFAGIIVALLSSMFIVFKIWVNFYLKTKHHFRNRTKKIKKIKIKPLDGEPREYTFTGIND